MFGQVFIIVMIGALGVLALHEVVRFRRAADNAEAIPYPRRRLQRRLSIAFLFEVLLLTTLFWPKGGPPLVLTWMVFGMMAILLLAMILLLRDLHETSRAVVQYSGELNRLNAQQMKEFLERQIEAQTGESKGDKAPPGP